MQTERPAHDAQSTGDGRRVVIGLVVLAVVATALLLTLTSQHGRVPAQVVGYSASADGRHLSLRVLHGTPGCDGDVQVTVSEAAQQVTLVASVQSLAQVCDAAALVTPFDVTLQAPLGGRTVVDGAHDNDPVPSS